MAYASVLPLAAKPNLCLLLIFIQGSFPNCNTFVYQHGHIQLLRGPCISHRFLFLLTICCWGLSAHFVKGIPSTFHLLRGRGCLAFIILVVFPCTIYFAHCICIITKLTLPQLCKRLKEDPRKGSISIALLAKEVAAGQRGR
ncbi:hypothetical protein V8C43DRAFT_260453 [Trichoderma afarasin]